MPSPSTPPTPPARSTRAVLTTSATAVALVVALLVLLGWAAAVGPDEVLRGDGPTVAPRSIEPSDAETTTAPPATASERDRPSGEPIPTAPLVGVVVFTLGLLALIALTVVGARWLVRRARRWLEERDPPEPDPADVDFEVLGAQGAADLVSAGADDARRRLASGAPRNAIVRCWADFELLAREAGLVHRDAETSAELTLRFFDAVAADTSAVQRLATLYREARFSDHEVTETDRRAADLALAAIHDSLRGARR